MINASPSSRAARGCKRVVIHDACLPSKLSGRTLTLQRGQTRKLAQRACQTCHFIPHGPLQRKLEVRTAQAHISHTGVAMAPDSPRKRPHTWDKEFAPL